MENYRRAKSRWGAIDFLNLKTLLLEKLSSTNSGANLRVISGWESCSLQVIHDVLDRNGKSTLAGR